MTLRSKLIRMAHQNPEIRPHILPLLKMGQAPLDTGRMQRDYDAVHKGIREFLESSRAVDLVVGRDGWESDKLVEPLWRLIYRDWETDRKAHV